jgi:hypothetical protein
MQKTIFQEMADRWKSPIVARTKIEAFTGGVMSEKYIANLDSAGKGPAGRVRMGRKIAYPVDLLCDWLEGRSSAVKPRTAEAK